MNFEKPSMNYSSSEELLCDIRRISNGGEIDLIEAVGVLCDERGVCIEDIISILDENTKEQLRIDAINNRHVVGINKIPNLF